MSKYVVLVINSHEFDMHKNVFKNTAHWALVKMKTALELVTLHHISNGPCQTLQGLPYSLEWSYSQSHIFSSAEITFLHLNPLLKMLILIFVYS